MNEIEEFDSKIEERLSAHRERQAAKGRLNVEATHDLQWRIEQSETMTRRFVDGVIRPRLVKLASRFDNAEVSELAPGEHQCVCSFRRTERFPATTKLEMGVTHDGPMQMMVVYYNLSILPVPFRFQGQDQLTIPLDQVDDARVVAWIEDKLVSFLDTYLPLESPEPDQTENLVTDPVCGMSFNKSLAAAKGVYLGQTYFFCVPDCHKKFTANPDQFVGAGHRP